MHTSTLLKIGAIGMFISVLSAFVPLLAALFGNENLSQWMSAYVNETGVTLVLMFFAGMIIYAMIKKGRERYLEETRNGLKR
ncbi:MAG TPA: hypothetical protein VJ961_07495 [Mariprofundaceae bacterium]|nr:hypothetical protein [Mariprofundaceae bacterium]